MSVYEWEAGTIKVPTAEFTGVKQAVLDVALAHNKALYDASQTFWKMLPPGAKKDASRYRKWAHAFCYGNDPSDKWDYDPKIPTMPPLGGRSQGRVSSGFRVMDYHDPKIDWLRDDLEQLLTWKCLKGDKPRRCLKTDIPAITNRTTSVYYDDFSIGFDRSTSTVRWTVDENNHACDRAHAHPYAIALFGALNRVTWTRGSGGEIVGNNEYHRDSRESGGGGNYTVMTFGPKSKRRASVSRW